MAANATNHDSQSKVWYGLSNVAIAFCKPDGTYEAPVRIPGAVRFIYEGTGDQEKFFADNGAYWVANGASGAEGELEMASFPNSIISKMLGWVIDDNGALIETTDGVATQFALLFEVSGDAAARRGAVYKITASAPKEEWATTEDNVTVKTTVLPYTAVAVDMGERKFAKATLPKTENNTEAWNNFYNEVYIPTFAAPASGE